MASKSLRVFSLLSAIAALARSRGIRIVASMDAHVAADDEISDRPDFRSTFPPHCMCGTPGQGQVPATRALAPVAIENRPYTGADLKQRIATPGAEIVLLKNRFDVFTQPNTNLLIELLHPRCVVTYGVALDVCVCHAVAGFLARGDIEVTVVRDAVRALAPARGAQILSDWEQRGVKVLDTSHIVGG